MIKKLNNDNWKLISLELSEELSEMCGHVLRLYPIDINTAIYQDIAHDLTFPLYKIDFQVGVALIYANELCLQQLASLVFEEDFTQFKSSYKDSLGIQFALCLLSNLIKDKFEKEEYNIKNYEEVHDDSVDLKCYPLDPVTQIKMPVFKQNEELGHMVICLQYR